MDLTLNTLIASHIYRNAQIGSDGFSGDCNMHEYRIEHAKSSDRETFKLLLESVRAIHAS
jgi:hypothetical protein